MPVKYLLILLLFSTTLLTAQELGLKYNFLQTDNIYMEGSGGVSFYYKQPLGPVKINVEYGSFDNNKNFDYPQEDGVNLYADSINATSKLDVYEITFVSPDLSFLPLVYLEASAGLGIDYFRVEVIKNKDGITTRRTFDNNGQIAGVFSAEAGIRDIPTIPVSAFIGYKYRTAKEIGKNSLDDGLLNYGMIYFGAGYRF